MIRCFVTRWTWVIHICFRGDKGGLVETKDTSYAAGGLDEAFHTPNCMNVTVEELDAYDYGRRQLLGDDERKP